MEDARRFTLIEIIGVKGKYLSGIYLKMKQDFSLSLENSRLFMKYFNAAMRDPEHGFMRANGSGYYDKGKYISEQSIDFEYKGQKLFVVWKIIFCNGIIESIENMNNEEDQSFNLLVSEFLNDILQRVLSNSKSKFFKRTIYLAVSGCNLPGEYWLPGFRFAPLLPEDDSRLINAERLIVFDQNVYAIDIRHADEVALNNAAKYSAFMSFILDVGIYAPIHEEKYFLEKDESGLNMIRKSTQIIDPKPINELPPKGTICSLASFENSIFNPIRYTNQYLVCPKETRKILRGIADSREDIEEAFLRCCLLYQLALNIGKHHPTVRISYICAAVEAIVKSNQKEYGSFSSFMTTYAGEANEIYSFIYDNIRSAHWHLGNFTLGDLNFERDFSMNPSSHITFNIIRESQNRMRSAILNWLYEKIALDKEPDK